MPADAEQKSEPFSMLDYVLNKKFEQKEEAQKPVTQPSPPAAESHQNQELEDLRKELSTYKSERDEFKSQLDKQHGMLQAFMKSEQGKQSGGLKEPEFQPMTVHNEELAAAMNALKTYTDQQFGYIKQSAEAKHQQDALQTNVSRFKDAVRYHRENTPDLKYITDEQLSDYFKPYAGRNDIDWRNELGMLAQTYAYPHVKAELAAAQKQLNEQNKKRDRDQETQRSNLKMVPGIGQRSSSSASGGRLVGDQILSDYSKNNRGKRPSYEQFGRELFKRISG